MPGSDSCDSLAAATYLLTPAAGTSVSAPFWAGLIALADQEVGHPLGFLNPAIYRIARGPLYHKAFPDITIGNNTVTLNGVTVTGYQAGPGWDRSPAGAPPTPRSSSLQPAKPAGAQKRGGQATPSGAWPGRHGTAPCRSREKPLCQRSARAIRTCPAQSAAPKITLRITVSTAHTVSTAWTAAAWASTFTINSPYTPISPTGGISYCPAYTVQAEVSGVS